MTRREQFFHGTAHDVAPGDSILPGKAYGKSSFRHGGRGPRGVAHSMSAFATTKEPEAWFFADASSVEHGGRARVHEVEPHPEMQPGLHNPEHPTFKRRRHNYADGGGWADWAAPSFKTTGRTVDIKPGHQGTFPQLNWNQFARPGSASGYRDTLNHPDPSEVHDGHYGSQMRKDHEEVEWAEAETGHGPYGTDWKKPPPLEHPGQLRLPL